MDEMPEFPSNVLEVLRQPMEDKKVEIARSHGVYVYPSDFMLVCALNPCPCGYYPDRNRCRCTEPEIKRYLKKISGPILDRIDIGIEAGKVSLQELREEKEGMSTKMMKEKVDKAREIQKMRYRGTPYTCNGELSAKEVGKYCILGEKEQNFLEKIYEKNKMSARSYHKVLKMARTVADVEGADRIGMAHLAEAIQYNSGKYYFLPK